VTLKPIDCRRSRSPTISERRYDEDVSIEEEEEEKRGLMGTELQP
jgi:hypothetical protein